MLTSWRSPSCSTTMTIFWAYSPFLTCQISARLPIIRSLNVSWVFMITSRSYSFGRVAPTRKFYARCGSLWWQNCPDFPVGPSPIVERITCNWKEQNACREDYGQTYYNAFYVLKNSNGLWNVHVLAWSGSILASGFCQGPKGSRTFRTGGAEANSPRRTLIWEYCFPFAIGIPTISERVNLRKGGRIEILKV